MANFFKVSNKKSNNNKVNANVLINIDKLDMNGSGVGYYKNKPVFVDGSLPKEKIEIKIVEQKNKYSRGKLLKVNTANENRVDVLCKHFSQCGGCDLQHLAYEEQLSFKQSKINELFSRSGIDNKVIKELPWCASIVSQQWNYRRKARLGVQFDKNAQAIIGFRQKATNQIISVKSCPTLVEPLNNIFPILHELIAKLTVKKAIGHIEVISVENNDNEQVLTVVVRQLKDLNELDRNQWSTFAKQHHWQVIFDLGKGKFEHLNEHAALSYLISDVVINFTNDDFIQVNQPVNEAMVEQAIHWLNLDANDQVLDLFCGLGNFSLPIAKRVEKVIGVEGVQSMVDKAKANAHKNQLTNCDFFQADLNSQWLNKNWAQQKFTKVLLDPARAGAEVAISQLATLSIRTILYVSCDPATLARDSQLLITQGYKITKISLIDMFSQTKHVETMVLFSK